MTKATGKHAPATVSVRDSSRWVVVSQVVKQVSQVATLYVLARLIAPAEFGVLVLATFVTRFVDMVIGDLGTASAIIQRQDLGEDEYSTIFWFNAAVGMVLTVLGVIAAPFMGPVFGSDRSAEVFQVAVLAFTIAGFGMVPQALLRKGLRFNQLVKVDLVVVVVTTTVALAGAAAGWGVWALVISNLAGGIANTAGVWGTSGFRPRRVYRVEHLRTVRSYSANLSLFRFVSFFSMFGDRFLVGRVLGERAAGLYTQPNRLNQVPLEVTAVMYRRVLFPSLSKMQDDLARMRKSYLRTVGAVVTAGAPVYVAMIVLAEPLVLALLDEKWTDAIPLVPIISGVGLMQLVSNSTSIVLQAKGRADLLLKREFVVFAVLGTGYGIGLTRGVEGVAWGYMIAVGFLLLPTLELSLRQIEQSMVGFWVNLWRQLAAIGCQFVVTWYVADQIADGAHWTKLIVATAAGVLSYLLVLVVSRDRHLGELLSMGAPALGRWYSSKIVKEDRI
ncbi:MAG: lipopolysaccharide biosynthesis protein [Acidimicrobiales bacterium]|nr:lipopolysaccharide biosynthesis protein [Acidimicrobiales bacterium]